MIFVDANAFIAIRNTTHPLHKKAVEISLYIAEEKEELITTNIIIAETLTILSMRVDKITAINFWKDFQKQNILVVYIDESYQTKAWEIFQKIKDKDISFFDCTSFAVMKSMGIKKAFSFDEDFRRYGFEIL